MGLFLIVFLFVSLTSRTVPAIPNSVSSYLSWNFLPDATRPCPQQLSVFESDIQYICTTSVVFGRFTVVTTHPVILLTRIPSARAIEALRLLIRQGSNCFNFIVERMNVGWYKNKSQTNIYKPFLDREIVINFTFFNSCGQVASKANDGNSLASKEINIITDIASQQDDNTADASKSIAKYKEEKLDFRMEDQIINPTISKSVGILSILNGQHLKISGNFFPPYIFTVVKDGVRIFAGANYQIINSAANKLNFTFDLDAPVGKPTGSLLPNGTWNGLFGDVYYGKSDLAIVLAHTVDRNGLIDFTTSFGAANLIFSTAFPKISVKPEAILYTYDSLVWTLILLTIVAMVPALYLTLRARGHFKDTFIQACMVIYKITIEQAAEIPQGLELLTGLYLLFTIIIATGYKSNLLALLSFPEAGKIPRNFPELWLSEDYNISMDMSGIAGYNYFMQGDSPMLINLRTRFASNLIRNNPAKCVTDSFLEPSAVCIGWDTVLNQAIGKNLTLTRGIKSLYLTQEAITRTWVTIGLQKNSKYTPAMSFMTSSYFETGHITKWHKGIVEDLTNVGIPEMKKHRESDTYRALVELAKSKTKGVSALKFNNVYIVFLMLGFGTVIATFGFGCEFAYHDKKKIKETIGHPSQLKIMFRSHGKNGQSESTEKLTFDYSNYTNDYEMSLS